jgi:hypothetical protein
LTAAFTVVDAIRLPEAGEDVPDSFFDWCTTVGFEDWCSGHDETIDILEPAGDGGVAYTAQPGDWIIKGADGQFRSMPHGDFIIAFEEVSNAKAG